MLTTFVYPWFFLIVWSVFGVFLAVMLLRLVFNYADPNPFGKVGRFGFKVRKRTEKWVYPAARFFAINKIDTRLAPLLTLLIGLLLTYFFTQVVGNAMFVIDGLTAGIATGDVKKIVGFILYGALSVLILFIFIRFLSSWFTFQPNKFLALVGRVTEPILAPARRLIPPVGMFDISAMLVLLFIGFLQVIVMNVFVR
ncbi:MAG: YggT family protein [Acidobacteriota bacterium]|nr:MAG: YggT family protein [Acidobacteriota bacterium]